MYICSKKNIKKTIIMKTRNQKPMMAMTAIALLICIVNIVWIFVQSYFIAFTSGEGCIVWHEGLLCLQIAVFSGRLIFKTLFYLLLIAFFVKQTKAIMNGTIFPRGNVRLLSLMAVSYFIGSTCNENLDTCLVFDGNTGSFVLNIDVVLYTLLLVVFAILYKIAVNVSEENNLTI